MILTHREAAGRERWQMAEPVRKPGFGHERAVTTPVTNDGASCLRKFNRAGRHLRSHFVAARRQARCRNFLQSAAPAWAARGSRNPRLSLAAAHPTCGEARVRYFGLGVALMVINTAD